MHPRYLIFLTLPLLAACGTGGAENVTEVERGAIIYERVCQACHQMADISRVGPGLKGIIGRPVAAVEGFDYSEAMLRDKDSGTWTPERVKSYLMGPMQMYPEGRMVIEPLSPEEASAVVAYLEAHP